MNKIYKLKFSRKTNELVAVAEIATNAVAQATAQPGGESLESRPSDSQLTTGNLISQTLVKYGLLAGSAVTLSLGSTLPAWAGNGLVDPTVVAGSATIATNGSVTTITNSPNTIINWQQFNIGKNELVQFIQESSNSAVLNRVLGNEVSEILGTLKSNGKVFLINPNGILFGANAVVDTSSLVASTLNMSDADFQAGKYVFNQEKDRAIASVLNQGLIKVQNDGTLALVGGNVVNTGILEAKNGSVYLLAGQSIQIADLNNPLISFKVTAGNKAVNLGEIVAKNVTMLAHGVNHGKDPVGNAFADLYTSGSANSSRISATGEVELYVGSISEQLQTNKDNNSQVTGERSGLAVVNGEISTTNATGKAGSVKVLADTVYVGSQSVINASGFEGGQVNIGGDYQGQGSTKLAQSTTLAADQLINVSGKSNAGTAIVWGDNLVVNGAFQATSEIGQGGLIETSGHGLTIDANTTVTTKANNGQNGKWLIDPDKLYICVTAPTSGFTQSNGSSTGNTHTYGSSTNGNNQYVLNSTIEKTLQNSNVELLAKNEIAANGVTINSTNKTSTLSFEAIHLCITDSVFNVGNLQLKGRFYQNSNTKLTNTTFNVVGSFITPDLGIEMQPDGREQPLNNNQIWNKVTINAKVVDLYLQTRDVKFSNTVIKTTESFTLYGGKYEFDNVQINDETKKTPVILRSFLGEGWDYRAQLGGGSKVYATSFDVYSRYFKVEGNSFIHADSTNITSTKTNIIFDHLAQGSQLSTNDNKVIFEAPSEITITSSEFTSGAINSNSTYVSIVDSCITSKSWTGNVSTSDWSKGFILENSSLKATGGDLEIRASGTDNYFKINKSNLNVAGNINLTTVGGWVGFENANISSGGEVRVISEKGNEITINATNITATSTVNISSGINGNWTNSKNFYVTNSNISMYYLKTCPVFLSST